MDLHKYKQLSLFDGNVHNNVHVNEHVNGICSKDIYSKDIYSHIQNQYYLNDGDNPFEPEYFCENCCDRCNVKGDNCFHNILAYGYDAKGNRIIVACRGQKYIKL